MKSLFSPRTLAAAAAAVGLLGFAGAAQARTDVFFSIGVPGVYAQPAPIYVQPAPVYVQPAPVYVAPRPAYVEVPRVYAPASVYAPVYVQPGYYTWQERAWRREQWRRHHWREREWERRYREDDDD
jgi:hypothetical protein